MSQLTPSSKKRKARSANLENGTDKAHPTLGPASTISVALRVRPFGENEEKNSSLKVSGNQVAVSNGDDASVFQFTNVFGMDTALDTVYSKAVSSLVSQALDGYNVCIMAYGQTGSGKTYCMSGNKDEPGMIPRFCMEIFNTASKRNDRDQVFMASFYEIYQEKAYDLLNTNHVPLRVRGGDDVYLQDLTVCQVRSFEELEAYRRTAWTRRATEATAMNICSSRSHAFIQLTYSHLEADLKELGDYVNRVTSNIYFVDLAGSERVSDVGYSYIDETVSINTSLSALHRVIACAGSRTKPSYRDSLLTRLLKDCLGGNARTVLIANVNPTMSQRSETLSTLRFASQAATVRQCAVKNIDPVVRALLGLKQENKALKLRIEQLESSSQQKLVSFDRPVAPSVVEFQADPSLTTWEPLAKELTFSAFDCDSSVVVFTLESNVITLTAREEGVFLNGDYLYPNIGVTVEHGDRVVLRGERMFFVYADDSGYEECTRCSYHALKSEYLERNFERFRAEVSEIEKTRRRSETDSVMKSLVEQIEGLKTALADKENQQIASQEKGNNVAKEQAVAQVELENCLTLKETFSELCKREISAFDVKFDNLAELLEMYSVKRDVEAANFLLTHFNKNNVYLFEVVLPDSEGEATGVRLYDQKNKMFGDLDKADFDSLLRRLREYHQQFTVPEDGCETVGQLMFKFCRKNLQMSRIGGSRMSNFVKTALYNSTVDAAKKRRTTISEFRLSIGGSKRKSVFSTNFASALGDVPECADTFETQFARRLVEIRTSVENHRKCGDSVELMCETAAELKAQLSDVRAIQRGAISSGIGFVAILCKFLAVSSKVDGFIQSALGFSHTLIVENCWKSVGSAWHSFQQFATSWTAMLSDPESEDIFKEIGPQCLEGMSEALDIFVTALGKLILLNGGKLPQKPALQEIKDSLIRGSREAIAEVKEEAEDVLLRTTGRPGALCEIATRTAEALILTCELMPEENSDEYIFTVISPLFAVVQRVVKSIVDSVELMTAERECARRSFVDLKSVVDMDLVSKTVVDQLKEALSVCERTMRVEAVSRMSIASIGSIASVFSDL